MSGHCYGLLSSSSHLYNSPSKMQTAHPQLARSQALPYSSFQLPSTAIRPSQISVVSVCARRNPFSPISSANASLIAFVDPIESNIRLESFLTSSELVLPSNGPAEANDYDLCNRSTRQEVLMAGVSVLSGFHDARKHVLPRMVDHNILIAVLVRCLPGFLIFVFSITVTSAFKSCWTSMLPITVTAQ